MKKLPTQLSDEELLNLLDNSTEETSKKKEFKNDVLSFISFYNLKIGNEMVPGQLLYDLYKQRGGERTRKGFYQVLTRFIPSKKFYHKNFYLLDHSSLQISEQIEKFLKKTPLTSYLKTNNHQKRHIESFIHHFKLKIGTELIPTPVLYNLYDLWCYKNKSKTKAMPIFSRLLQFYIPTVKHEKKTYYKLDKSFFNIMSKQQIENFVRKQDENKEKK